MARPGQPQTDRKLNLRPSPAAGRRRRRNAVRRSFSPVRHMVAAIALPATVTKTPKLDQVMRWRQNCMTAMTFISDPERGQTN